MQLLINYHIKQLDKNFIFAYNSKKYSPFHIFKLKYHDFTSQFLDTLRKK